MNGTYYHRCRINNNYFIVVLLYIVFRNFLTRIFYNIKIIGIIFSFISQIYFDQVFWFIKWVSDLYRSACWIKSVTTGRENILLNNFVSSFLSYCNDDICVQSRRDETKKPWRLIELQSLVCIRPNWTVLLWLIEYKLKCSRKVKLKFIHSLLG